VLCRRHPFGRHGIHCNFIWIPAFAGMTRTKNEMNQAIVTTISDRCKRCYSCVRECPASAIRVIDAQAQVIEERCIACGHCVKVCSQDAKQIFSEMDITYELLKTNNALLLWRHHSRLHFLTITEKFRVH
jgi:ferredoxin